MTALQIISYIGIPLTALLAAVVLAGFARPDRSPDGTYAVYLSLASLFALFTLLLAAATGAESLAGHLIIDRGTDFGDGFRSVPAATLALSGMFGEGDLAPAIGWGAASVAMAVTFVFHARRRAELLERGDPVVQRVERAYCAAACFAMLQIAVIGAVVAGVTAYQFVDRPVGLVDDRVEFAAAQSLIYAGLVVAAYLIFRTYFWRIREGGNESGNDLTGDGDVRPVAEIDEL